MSSQYFLLSTGGEMIEITSKEWKVASSLIYVGEEIEKQGLEAQRVWFTAQAGDPAVGIEITLEDTSGNLVAGPGTFYGSIIPQLSALLPLRKTRLRTKGPPQVLIVKARNRSEISPPSFIGQVLIECKPKQP